MISLKNELEKLDAAYNEKTRKLSVVALPKSRDFTSDDVINAINEQLISVCLILLVFYVVNNLNNIWANLHVTFNDRH